MLNQTKQLKVRTVSIDENSREVIDLDESLVYTLFYDSHYETLPK